MKYLGKKVEIRYAYDPDVDRWYTRDTNIPGFNLAMEGDSIEEIERDLPEALAMIEEVIRSWK